MLDPNAELPQSIAIAGAWGYIGRKLLDAALALQLDTSVHDPGAPPTDVAADRYRRITDAARFYRLPADFFHLALHPEARRFGMETLLARPDVGDFLVLVEKPMAAPETPAACREIIQRVDAADARVLYGFLELFDDMTRRIVEFLGQFKTVRFEEMSFRRSKDREAPENPRNYKRMVPIQYQESVHCLAFAMYLLGQAGGSLPEVFRQGLRVRASSKPYQPPNPDVYPYIVDGQCRWSVELGATKIDGITDFSAGAPWSKQRLIRGIGDGKPFTIEANYLENHKSLVLNGAAQDVDPAASSYVQIIRSAWRWACHESRAELMNGVYPNPRFAQATYQLSSVLWHSAHHQRDVALGSFAELLEFNAGFAEAVPSFQRY